MAQEIKFHVGIGDGVETKLLHSVIEQLSKAYGGVSVQTVSGGWWSEDQKKIVIESSLIFSLILDYPHEGLEKTGEWLRGLFHQEAVLTTAQELKSQMISRSLEP